METLYKKHNPIKINSRGIIVADPCYNKSVHCILKLRNVLKGMYNTYYSLSELKGWGTRIKDLIILHDSIDFDVNTLCNFMLNKEYIDDISVDSGTAGFFNNDYYNKHHYNDSIDDDWYEEYICEKLGQIDVFEGKCFISSSGLGDGSYGVYALYNEDNKIIGVQIEYLCDEEED